MMTDCSESVRALVHELLDAGCDLMAVGKGYVVNEPDDLPGRLRVQEILERFGPRLHLVKEISDHIRSLGRFYDP